MIVSSEHNLQLGVNIKKKLKGFSLGMEFKAGKGCLGTLGSSGCGKSMTLKFIARIIKPDSGRIAVQYAQDEAVGERVLRDPSLKVNQKSQARCVGYLLWNYASFPNMIVEQSIATGLNATGGRLSGARKCWLLTVSEKGDKVREVISRFRLGGLGRRYPFRLSNGQQQRVALARILACGPEALLLDEPFSATDTYLRERLRLELAKMTLDYDGVTVMVIHDRGGAYQLYDNLLLLDRGRVLSGGRTRDIFQEPITCQAARLMGCENISRTERLGNRRIKTLDWGGLELVTDRKVDDTTTAMGIRVHDFEPPSDGEANARKQVQNRNLIRMGTPSISEMPFEWYITLDNGLWWKKEKDIHTHNTARLVPAWLHVEPSALLLLTGNLE